MTGAEHAQDWVTRWMRWTARGLGLLACAFFLGGAILVGIAEAVGGNLAGCGRMGSDPEQAGSKAVVGRGFALGGEVRGA